MYFRNLAAVWLKLQINQVNVCFCFKCNPVHFHWKTVWLFCLFKSKMFLKRNSTQPKFSTNICSSGYAYSVQNCRQTWNQVTAGSVPSNCSCMLDRLNKAWDDESLCRVRAAAADLSGPSAAADRVKKEPLTHSTGLRPMVCRFWGPVQSRWDVSKEI